MRTSLSISIIRKQLPRMIAAQIVGIQPMTNTNNIFNMSDEHYWTQWRRTISIWPRRSINNKIIFGWINKRSREDMRPGWGEMYILRPNIIEFATDKELFTAKLKGRK